MSGTAIMIGTLLAPLAAAWALSRAFSGMFRFIALLPLFMFVVNLVLEITDLSCKGGGFDTPWSECSLPGLASFSNPLTTLYFYNLTAILTLTPGLLIVAGIAALIRRERHET